MFEEKKLLTGIKNAFNKHYDKARKEVLSELNASGYKGIIEEVNISDDFQDINIVFSDNIVIDKGQDIIELLCQGGAVKKKDTERGFITIPGSSVLRKYLSKR